MITFYNQSSKKYLLRWDIHYFIKDVHKNDDAVEWWNVQTHYKKGIEEKSRLFNSREEAAAFIEKEGITPKYCK